MSPLYEFKCTKCQTSREIKLSFSEHENTKHDIMCNKCGANSIQVITPLRFKLKGEGWFGGNADAVASAYGLTQMELDKNLDNEKRVEDIANNYVDHDND